MGQATYSRGHAVLTAAMSRLLPGEDVVTEYSIGERLRLDVYCPRYKLGAEYHGRQHFDYVEHFHRDLDGFRDSQRRDERKLELCRERGIALVVFTYQDELTEDYVYGQLLAALQARPITPYMSEAEADRRAKKRAWAQEAWRRAKEWKKTH